MKSLFRQLLRWMYGFRVEGGEALRTPGPVLLIPNHVSWLDWLFLWVCLDDDWKFVTSSVTAATSWPHRVMMINRHTFPIDPRSPYAVKKMAEFLQRGGRLVLFAEGRISSTGALMKIFEGAGFLLLKTGAPVITCHLRGAKRLPWVRHSGWTRWFPTVTAHFSPLLRPPAQEGLSATAARPKLTHWLLDQMVRQQFEVEFERGPQTPLEAIAQMARQRPGQIALEDFTGQKLSYRRLMAGARLLADRWAVRFGDETSERIGVLLPGANACPTVLLSLWASKKTPALLNFSTGTASMLACAQLAGIKTIVTSRLFLEKAKLKLEPLREAGIEILHLEDLRAEISGGAKIAALVSQWIAPGSGFGLPAPETTAVILFTSGSEGMPKGVDLSHRNLMANLTQMLSMIDLEDHDRVFNALPMFHSFGLTVGTLLPLTRGLYCFLYPSPLHYRVVPAAVYDRACTVMLGTNTFLNGYARKADPYDFRTVRFLFSGAEKLQEATANTWARRFGVRILEGYGATECGPALTLNTPMRPCYGSAGRFLPGIEHRLERVEGVGEGGRLFVRGPNVMRGYLNHDADAAFQELGGWYDTGDIVTVDDEGFVHIQGRLKRFAKISGEMVSLTAVEEALAGAFPHYGLRFEVAILSKPDPDKGEALIAVANDSRASIEELRAVIRAKGLPNLCAPRELRYAREIPKLGTGKVNHRKLVELIGGQ